ncbi:hypothetical protein ACFL54_04805 [Planctomycetota bacterium]
MCAPVNVNTTSVELLEALIAPVQGWFLMEGPGEEASDWHYGRWSAKQLLHCQSDEDQNTDWGHYRLLKGNILGWGRLTPELPEPGNIAQAIKSRVDNIGPFSTWQEFENFLRYDMDSGLFPDNFFENYPCDHGWYMSRIYPDPSIDWLNNYFRQIFVEALIANFNPNSRIRDYNPNRNHHLHVDKAHLANYSTELCFEPTGTFEITSRGYIYQEDVLASEYEIFCAVKKFEILHITTQEQFLQGLTANADITDYLGENVAAMESTAWGAQLCSFPEPLRLNQAPSLSPFDGYLSLSTWEPDGQSGSQYANVPFIVNFDGRLKPYRIAAGATRDMYTVVGRNYPGLNENPTTDILTNREDSPGMPGVLFPDGAFSDTGRTLSYDNRNVGENGGCSGAIMFWVKPHFNTALTNRPHKLFSLYSSFGAPFFDDLPIYYFGHNPSFSYLNCVNEEVVDTNLSMMYADGISHGPPAGLLWIATHSIVAGWSVGGPVFGIASPTVCHDYPLHCNAVNHCLYNSPEYNFEDHLWNHIGFSWDYRSCLLDNPTVVTLTINGQDVMVDHTYNHGGGAGSDLGSDLQIHSITNPSDRNHYMRFGGLGNGTTAYKADATYDTIIGYAQQQPFTTYVSEWQFGRYYNEGDATYTSPEIDIHRQLGLMPNSMLALRSVSWTLYWAPNNRDGDAIVDNIQSSVININDLVDPTILNDWDPIAVDVFTSRTGWLYESYPGLSPTYAGGSDIKMNPATGGLIHIGRGDIFRFRALFNASAGQTLYESPILDDITFTFDLVKPEVKLWVVGRKL